MIFKQLVNLRDQLSDIATRNNLMATLSAASDNCGSYSSVVDGITLKYDDDEQQMSILNTHTNHGVTYRLVDIPDNLAANIPDSNYTVSDVLGTMSATGDLYTMLSNITHKLTYSNRLSLTNINQIIDSQSVIETVNYDVALLKNQLLSVADNDGYISAKTWLISLKTWIQACKTGADNNSPALDNTSPTIISGLYNVAVIVLSTVLSAICAALSLVFGAVALLISSTISKLFDVLSEYFSSQVEIDVNAPNNFAKGVMHAGVEHNCHDDSSKLHQLWLTCKNDYGIRCFDTPTLTVFYWRGDVEGDIKFNSYIEPKYTPEEIVNWLSTLDDVSVSITGTEATSSTVGNMNIWRISSIDWYPTYMSEEEANRMSVDPDFYAQCLVASEVMRALVCSPTNFSINGTGYDPKLTNYTAYSHNHYTKIICDGMSVLGSYWFNFGDRTNWYDSNTLFSDIADWLVDNFNNRESITNINVVKYADVAMNVCYPVNMLYTGCTDNSAHDAFGFNIRFYKSSGETYYDLNSVQLAQQYVIQANCLPCTFAISFKQTNIGEVVSLLVLTSLAAIAAAFVYTKVAQAIRIKKIEKQTVRSNRLLELKQAYENDPTNKVKLREYASAVDKYNRMGRILGWGTYDATNGWFDRSDSGSSTPSLANATLTGAGQAIANYNKLTSMVGSDSDTTLTNIKSSVNSIVGSNPQTTLTSLNSSINNILGVNNVTNSDIKAYLTSIRGTDTDVTLKDIYILIAAVKDLIKS